jgi:hypothetical protein
MMKILKTACVITALIFLNMNLYSQEINDVKKTKLLIYDFITTDNYENVKKKENNYKYYSLVIPQTISKSLKDSSNYEIVRESGPFSIETDIIDKSEKKKYINKLIDLGRQNNSDYIITGNFNVEDKKLTLSLVIFDVRGKQIETVDHVSDELGVKLRTTTDQLSQIISEKIANLDLLFRESEASSRFNPLNTPLSIITLGVDSGYLYILGEWRSLYEDSFYIAPFIDFNITDYLSISLKFTAIESNSKDDEANVRSRLKILSSSLSLSYLYRFNSSFAWGLSAGGGASKTTITIDPASPFEDSLSEEDSYDPNIDISSYFTYDLSSLTFRTGFLYKRIFYKDEPMDNGVIFAGIGIHF